MQTPLPENASGSTGSATQRISLSGAVSAVCAILFLAIGTLSAQVDSTTLELPPDTTIVPDRQTPIITVTADDLDSELGGQDVSGILQSSRDIFISTAGFNFGSARFRIRGYDSDNTLVTMNGVMVNDLESGWASWSDWGGLNDVTRYTSVTAGVGPTNFNFGSIGGTSDINIRPGAVRKGIRVSYASANRSYNNRIMLSGSTGVMKNGWNVSFSGSRRWAQEGYVPGTPFNAYAYYLAAEKQLSKKHAVSFAGFGAPIVRGRQGLAIQEAYDLAGTNYYNPNWGYQDGEVRNARMTFDHKPLVMASHIFTPTDSVTLTTTVFYAFGRDGSTQLNWFDAQDPRPDYYRYLPSYNALQDPGLAAQQAVSWSSDPSVQQLNWDQFYFANDKNLYTVENANGSGTSVTGNRSKYIVEEQRADPKRIGLNSVYRKNLLNNRNITVGLNFNRQSTHYFNVLDDLLGGDFWVDIDQFADRDFDDPIISQNDLSTPNKVAKEGDVIGWDYNIVTRATSLFGQYEKKWQKVEVYAAAHLAQTSFRRDGNVQNGRFPETSEGKGESQDFLTGGIKAGATYKITGRQFIVANAAYLNRPPSPRNSFLSARTRPDVIPGLQSESVYTGDIGYVVRYARLKARATFYYTKMMDQMWSRFYYNDEALTVVNYSMSGVDQINKGVEVGIEANLTSTIQMTAVYAGGDYRYSSRPLATITQNNSANTFAENRVIYWENYKVGGMPQTAASVGLRYNHPKFWFVGFNANYFGNIYLDPNPDRRTAEAIGNYVDSDPQVAQLLDQVQLDDNYTVDAFAGKSWMIQRKYRIALNISVSNILNNQDFKVGGFEQLRYDRTNVDKFPPKFSYLYGRNYFAMLTFSF
ncbi:MAG: TonB-dependent receptor plug domain-containing protein [Flavobacteriales bacterium]|nr:TonB-dependent receptor plug domain-containing protein [Flavobacteriales bacterium]MBK6943847.1 TonB-dependent receptor plug domain-containing protein [Flavobacteriales bacterium]MBK7240056.1 TonB-dependent receptor plug domain-containing protein [Flavobacteriales bacterium]MBK7297108.1 TonB-dependent receptor plug domain-containing protein [Flavobacteriales bacterium]MBK9535621.1 TonB-dependent receptor plug domain-containing protein [Flavobacteriales bacterium]